MKISLIFTLLIILASCSDEKSNQSTSEEHVELALPFFNSEDFTPEWIDKKSDEYAFIHTIAPFQLVNQNGDTISNATFENKIYVADFFFTYCGGICPKLTDHLSKVQSKFENDPEVLILSHTVMPATDSVSVLREYADIHGAIDNKWHFVTGPEEEIYDLARNSYFADEDFKKTKDESAFVHTENFLLIDKKGRIRGVYNGTVELEIDHLIEHIERLKKED